MQHSSSATFTLSPDWQEQPITASLHEASGRRQILVATTKQGWGNLIVDACKPVETRSFLQNSLDDLRAQLRQFHFANLAWSYFEHKGIPVIKVTGICEAENSLVTHYLLAFASETILVTGTFTIDHPEGSTNLLGFVEPRGEPNRIVVEHGSDLCGDLNGE